MRSPRAVIPLFLVTLSMVSLACGLPFGKPSINAPAAVETAEAAARTAGSVAGTAAAMAGDLAETAVAMATAEGSGAVATVMAAGTPGTQFLKDKLAEIEPDADGNYRISLTENELNVVLRVRQLFGGDLLGAAVQSQQVTLEDGMITFSGTILEPLPGEIRVRMRPTVADGQLQLNVVDASAAGKDAPQQAIDAAEEAISDAVSEALGYVGDGIQLTEIDVAGGELTIVGR